MKEVDKNIQKAVEYLSKTSLVSESFPNASVDYCANSGMLYIEDRSTGEQLAMFRVVKGGVDEI